MQAKLLEQLSLADAEIILGRLPDRIGVALIARDAEIEYPIAAVIEMAIASFQGHRGIRFRRLQTRTRAVKLSKLKYGTAFLSTLNYQLSTIDYQLFKDRYQLE